MSKANGADTNASMNEGSNQDLPPLVVHAQYIKDLSFENPNPLKALQDGGAQPELSLGIDVGADRIGDNAYEVTLKVKVDAKRDEEVLFVTELDYAGVFSLNNVSEDMLTPVLMIECPRMLFPYARAIIAQTTREGGYPALSLAPVDFVELFKRHVQQAQQEQAAAKADS
ncbi:MAG: protein-export chaperone SecB [Holosporales bacterium]